MSKNVSQAALVLPSWLRSWERFWFTPADPTLWAMIRIGAGLIATYVLFVYSFQLQDMMGPNAWYDQQLRLEMIHDRPLQPLALLGPESDTIGEAIPTTEKEREYVFNYKKNYVGHRPPPPFPRDPEEERFIDQYIAKYNVDLRVFGLHPPREPEEKEYLLRYTEAYGFPPPAYPASKAEEEAIDTYMARYGFDPRRLYSRGITIWSVWLHVNDPTHMAVIHGLAVATGVLFTLGFATRITSALLWFFMLNYIHRNSQVQFGMDTMMVILLTYLAIGPSGAALSVDRLLARWWSRAKPGAIRGWYRLLGRPAPADGEIAPVAYSPQPQPLVSANVALRLLQLHVCIIYLMAGLSKLLGPVWWDGTACWRTLANPEFAPFQLQIYDKLIRWLASTTFPLYAFLNIGTLFTLCFEIGYAFLIWRPKTRWAFLAGALILHGVIGLFMGLKTFSLIMLVMNMVFLSPQEANWLLGWFTPSATPAPPTRTPAAVPEPVGRAAVATGVTAQR
jgi:uncharacterized membrane protein YphA (DoxX/SURF4 family)